MPKALYDVIIIGAGPAGLTAGLYASRRDLKTLILSKNIGGQALLSHEIENYPGFEGINGIGLIEKFGRQAVAFGADMKFGEVNKIIKEKNKFTVKTANDRFAGRALILALGLTPRSLGVPGEKKLIGRGVAYCATCDGPLYRHKTVAVIGGGNSALGSARYLSNIAKQIYLIHRREEFRGEAFSVKELRRKNNVKIILNSKIVEIKGQQFVESIMIEDKKNKTVSEIKLDGVFIEIGYLAEVDFLNDLVRLNANKEIITDKNTKTSTAGIFACGDITNGPDKQIVIAAGDGAKAALAAYRYLSAQKKDKKVLPDWE